jgi:Helix-turn-helix domain
MTTTKEDFIRARAAFLVRAAELSQKERDHARLSFLDELRRSPLSTAKLVGWEIVQCVDESLGYAWPKGETLAEWLNIDERTVVRAVEELERVPVILVERVRRRVNHYLVPYFWVLGDKLSLQRSTSPNVGRKKMSPTDDRDVPRKGDKDAPLTPFKSPYSSPESRGYRGRDVGSALAAQLATELWRIARIDVVHLSHRQRRNEIGEVQSWLDAGWTPDVIRISAIDQMRTRSPDAEAVRCLGIFRKKLQDYYAALAARRMAG